MAKLAPVQVTDRDIWHSPFQGRHALRICQRVMRVVLSIGIMKGTPLRWRDGFIISVATLLLTAAFLKLASVQIPSPEAVKPNPVLGLKNIHVAILAVLIESAVGVYLLLGHSKWRKLWVIAGLANCLAAYRIALSMSGVNLSCGCLGIATQLLPYLGRMESRISLLALLFMLGGSWLFLWRWEKGNIPDYSKPQRQ